LTDYADALRTRSAEETTMRPDDGGFSYPAHMQEITFPTGAATEAQTVLNRIAGLLDTSLQARPGMVAGAQDGWEGAYRQEFDETWRIQETRLANLKEDLQTLAGQIQTAMDNVAAENQHRSTQREQYLAEHSEPAGAN
jgi:uncharacterized protein YukE